MKIKKFYGLIFIFIVVFAGCSGGENPTPEITGNIQDVTSVVEVVVPKESDEEIAVIDPDAEDTKKKDTLKGTYLNVILDINDSNEDGIISKDEEFTANITFENTFNEYLTLQELQISFENIQDDSIKLVDVNGEEPNDSIYEISTKEIIYSNANFMDVFKIDGNSKVQFTLQAKANKDLEAGDQLFGITALSHAKQKDSFPIDIQVRISGEQEENEKN